MSKPLSDGGKLPPVLKPLRPDSHLLDVHHKDVQLDTTAWPSSLADAIQALEPRAQAAHHARKSVWTPEARFKPHASGVKQQSVPITKISPQKLQQISQESRVLASRDRLLDAVPSSLNCASKLAPFTSVLPGSKVKPSPHNLAALAVSKRHAAAAAMSPGPQPVLPGRQVSPSPKPGAITLHPIHTPVQPVPHELRESTRASHHAPIISSQVMVGSLVLLAGPSPGSANTHTSSQHAGPHPTRVPPLLHQHHPAGLRASNSSLLPSKPPVAASAAHHSHRSTPADAGMESNRSTGSLHGQAVISPPPMASPSELLAPLGTSLPAHGLLARASPTSAAAPGNQGHTTHSVVHTPESKYPPFAYSSGPQAKPWPVAHSPVLRSSTHKAKPNVTRSSGMDVSRYDDVVALANRRVAAADRALQTGNIVASHPAAHALSALIPSRIPTIDPGRGLTSHMEALKLQAQQAALAASAAAAAAQAAHYEARISQSRSSMHQADTAITIQRPSTSEAAPGLTQQGPVPPSPTHPGPASQAHTGRVTVRETLRSPGSLLAVRDRSQQALSQEFTQVIDTLHQDMHAPLDDDDLILKVRHTHHKAGPLPQLQTLVEGSNTDAEHAACSSLQGSDGSAGAWAASTTGVEGSPTAALRTPMATRRAPVVVPPATAIITTTTTRPDSPEAADLASSCKDADTSAVMAPRLPANLHVDVDEAHAAATQRLQQVEAAAAAAAAAAAVEARLQAELAVGGSRPPTRQGLAEAVAVVGAALVNAAQMITSGSVVRRGSATTGVAAVPASQSKDHSSSATAVVFPPPPKLTPPTSAQAESGLHDSPSPSPAGQQTDGEWGSTCSSLPEGVAEAAAAAAQQPGDGQEIDLILDELVDGLPERDPNSLWSIPYNITMNQDVSKAAGVKPVKLTPVVTTADVYASNRSNSIEGVGLYQAHIYSPPRGSPTAQDAQNAMKLRYSDTRMSDDPGSVIGTHRSMGLPSGPSSFYPDGDDDLDLEEAYEQTYEEASAAFMTNQTEFETHTSQSDGNSEDGEMLSVSAFGITPVQPLLSPGHPSQRQSARSVKEPSLNDMYDGNVRLLGQKYEVLDVVGEGAYGMVMKCRVRGADPEHWVAIKEFKISDDDPDAEDVKRTSRREVSLLRCLQHPHVVACLDDFFVHDRLFIVMEYVPCNLLELLEAQPGGMDKEAVRLILYQLCTAIAFIHSKKVVYRDIKPENLLVDEQGRLKLCDFGFARFITGEANEQLTDYVATRWYRAPELLLGPPFQDASSQPVHSHYGTPTDIWAIGCLMGELMDGEPLFPGDSDLDQLYRIQTILGSVTDEQAALFKRNPANIGITFNIKDPMTLSRRYESVMNDVELDFMSGLLTMDPAKRMTGEQCLQHPYLIDLWEADKAHGQYTGASILQQVQKQQGAADGNWGSDVDEQQADQDVREGEAATLDPALAALLEE